MKVIISHDVDTVRPWEHRNDLIVPKFAIRFAVEWMLGHTRFNEVKGAISSLWSGKWQYLEELMDFDQANGVPSTFFVAVAIPKRGRGRAHSGSFLYVNKDKSELEFAFYSLSSPKKMKAPHYSERLSADRERV